DRRDGAVRIRQLGWALQPRLGAFVRPGPAAGRLCRDERTMLRVGSGPQEQRDGSLRGAMTRKAITRSPRSHKRSRISLYTCLTVTSLFLSVSCVVVLFAQAPDATRLLQEYVRIDTSNPPGDTRKAADFLAAIFAREGITDVKRYESEP